MTRSHSRSIITPASSRRPALVATGAVALASCLVALGISFGSSANAALPTIDLGVAEDFAVLGASTVTNSGGTTTIRTEDAEVLGDVGVFSAGGANEITGIADFVWEPPAGGSIATTDESQAAQAANLAAYGQAAAQTPTGDDLTQLAGETLTPGVYRASEALNLAGNSTVTLDAQGDPDAEFIIQVGSSLTMEVGSTVELVGEAQACHVFWQVEEDASILAGSTFVGTVLAENTITAGTGATFEGRLLAQVGAVTLLNNTFTMPGCSEPVVADDVADDVGGDDTAGDDTAGDDVGGDDTTGDDVGGDDAGTDADGTDADADGTDADADANVTDADAATDTDAETAVADGAQGDGDGRDLPDAGGPSGILLPLGAAALLGGAALLMPRRRAGGSHRAL